MVCQAYFYVFLDGWFNEESMLRGKLFQAQAVKTNQENHIKILFLLIFPLGSPARGKTPEERGEAFSIFESPRGNPTLHPHFGIKKSSLEVVF